MKYKLRKEESKGFSYNTGYEQYSKNEFERPGVVDNLLSILRNSTVRVVAGVTVAVTLCGAMGYSFYKTSENENTVSNHTITIEGVDYRVGDLMLVTTKDEKKHLCVQKTKVISQGGYNPNDVLYPLQIEPAQIEYIYHDVKKDGSIINNEDITKTVFLTNAIQRIAKYEDIFGYIPENKVEDALDQIIR